ncbi:hypothetical protein F5Y09DRAFT_296023 [Xylaria sp. FL1042]|nr:hypothetical protein F5Y09DRAFT_296023 [Xylaria sp. FL1042]
MPGAVKAMAALFDSAVKESPDKAANSLSSRTRHSRGESNSFSYREALNESPTRSKPHRGAPVPMKARADLYEHPQQGKPAETLTPKRYIPTPKNGLSTVRTAPRRPMVEHTPPSMRSTLKPVKTFSPARNEPQSSISINKAPYHETNHNHNHPPRLGTMVPHEEEPQISHFVRPTSATSAQGQNDVPASLEGGPGVSTTTTTRQTSSLHAQIRALQRQLENKNEETAQLRRRLETLEHMDIGTLCEQLRVARRECLMWRKRAEAAERRVAVVHRFGAKFEGLKDGAVDEHEHEDYDTYNYNYGDEDDTGTCVRGSLGRGKRVDYGGEVGDEEATSSYSFRTESRELFNDRIRRSFARKMADSVAGDGGIFHEDCVEGTSDVGVRGGYQLSRDKSPRTVKLWEAAQEMFDLRHRDDIYVLGREHGTF